MFDLFKAKAEAVSAEVHRFPAKGPALDFIKETFRKEGVADAPQAYAVWVDCPFLEGVDKDALAGEFPGLTFNVTRDKAEQSRIGVTQMHWGIANTGTVAQNSTDPKERLASMLPWLHIAIVGTDAILPDLPALLETVHPKDCAYLALISGPSRTADIERVLTIGVHGPERLIIVCIDDLGGQN
ncbi:Lactate utilization protein C [Fundidesulfovibrio magnetotacticus]|uniref:Lactate utilization protein C n=1 Tax=Fundidesulfovibrio magnetotacticus TaxID=2730080 RepID=A0A6V8M3K2_9BACT|nr:lactate utilization protein [Fundidesulfovibrio magnetotacticus]GFK95045.1 Lactate utilization protein C [Fundidesulfovibrio magnetotacticus]